MADPTLLKPNKVVVNIFTKVSHTRMKQLIGMRRYPKKYGFAAVAVDVEECQGQLYNVRMEYIALYR